VALVCGQHRPDLDGVAGYVARLAGALAGAGAEPLVVPMDDGRGAGPAAVARTARRLHRLALDVVHVQFAPSAYGYRPGVGVLPLLRPRAPVLVTTLHEYGWWAWPARVPDALWRPLERRRLWDRETLTLAPRSHALVVTNPAHAAAVTDRLAVAPTVVPVAANITDPGGDRAGDRRALRARLGLPPAARVLVFFGFVHPVKGVRYLLEALAALRHGHPDLHLVVAGGFTSLALPEDEARAFRTELEGRAAALGVTEAVTFTGHLPAEEVSAVLRAADVAVLPMTAGVTAKSGSLLAAFDHALPVVATAPDRPDPALVDGRTAVLVPERRSAPALEAALRRVLEDAGLRERVARGGAAVARERSWPAVGAAHAELYARLLAARAAAAPGRRVRPPAAVRAGG